MRLIKDKTKKNKKNIHSLISIVRRPPEVVGVTDRRDNLDDIIKSLRHYRKAAFGAIKLALIGVSREKKK